MKIAIISDIHGNMAYLERAKQIIDKEKLEIIVCCGDIQEIEVFKELDSWKPKTYLALGNADYHIRDLLNRGLTWAEHMEVFLDFGVLNIDGCKIAFCHYDFLGRKLAESGKYNAVFYGHTHTPWEEKIGKTIFLNPGEITAQFGKATMAIFDTKTLKSKLVLI